jgi:hypothetical protein
MMRKYFLPPVLLLMIVAIPTARADLFGGDVAVLTQILAQNVKQLLELQRILGSARENLSLLRDINRGINDSLQMIRTISPYVDAGTFGELKKVEDVLRKFQAIYGTVVESPDAPAQRSVDAAIAEAVTMNSTIHDYTAEIDKVGEEIKSFSHAVSPGGAAKLTAESLGVMLHVLNQQLRATGALLKLEAEGLAATNKREKDHTAEYLRSAGAIANALKDSHPTFLAPRF